MSCISGCWVDSEYKIVVSTAPDTAYVFIDCFNNPSLLVSCIGIPELAIVVNSVRTTAKRRLFPKSISILTLTKHIETKEKRFKSFVLFRTKVCFDVKIRESMLARCASVIERQLYHV